MQVKYLAGIVGAALLLAGCSSSNELTSAGQNVRFVQEKPGAECQLLGTATGKQSNWLSGQNGDEGGSMRGAANALRNQGGSDGRQRDLRRQQPDAKPAVELCAYRQRNERPVYKCPN